MQVKISCQQIWNKILLKRISCCDLSWLKHFHKKQNFKDSCNTWIEIIHHMFHSVHYTKDRTCRMEVFRMHIYCFYLAHLLPTLMILDSFGFLHIFITESIYFSVIIYPTKAYLHHHVFILVEKRLFNNQFQSQHMAFNQRYVGKEKLLQQPETKRYKILNNTNALL